MKTDETAGLFGALILAILVIGGGIGWGLNIVALANATAFSGMVLLRVAGIFVAPLGGVLGWV